MITTGRAFFQQVVDRQLEGVVAKRLDSLYRPGRREGAWIKIKPSGSKSLANFGGYPVGEDQSRMTGPAEIIAQIGKDR